MWLWWESLFYGSGLVWGAGCGGSAAVIRWERGRDWEVRGGAHVREQAVVWK